MDFLKVNSTPVPKSTGYETYFTKFGGQKNYYASLDELEVGLGQVIPYMLFLVLACIRARAGRATAQGLRILRAPKILGIHQI